MTGRELIIYILQNGLEDEEIVVDGKFLGLLTPEEAAVRANVGTGTIYTWIALGKLPYIKVHGLIYIPANFEPPFEGSTKQ